MADEETSPTDVLMTGNPYRAGLAWIAGLLAVAGLIAAIAGAVEQNKQDYDGVALAGAAQFAWANWLLSGAALAFMFWLAVSGISWVIARKG